MSSIDTGVAARSAAGAAPGGTNASSSVRERATVFAPASVGNVAIGFDILGFAVDSLGDKITVTRRDEPGVGISRIHGIAGDLPTDPTRNTAGQALLAMCEGLKLPFGF